MSTSSSICYSQGSHDSFKDIKYDERDTFESDSSHDVSSKSFSEKNDVSGHLSDEILVCKIKMKEFLKECEDNDVIADELKNILQTNFSKRKARIIEKREILIDQINNMTKTKLEEVNNFELDLNRNISRVQFSFKEYLNDFKIQIDTQFENSKPDFNQFKQGMLDLVVHNKVLNELAVSSNVFMRELDSFSFLPSLIHLEDGLFEKIKQDLVPKTNLNLITCHNDGSIRMRHLVEEIRWDTLEGKHEGTI